MSKANRPRIGCISMPCSPSVPPVMSEKRSASASSNSAMPSVTISRVRSTPRITRKLVTKAEHHGGEAGDDQRDHRLGDDAVQRQQPGAIGADAEERGMAERDDAGIAEDQIERQREQRQPHDVGHDQIARGKQEGAGERERSRTRSRSSASARAAWRDIRRRLARSWRAQRAAVRPNRPFGRQIRITIMMV